MFFALLTGLSIAFGSNAIAYGQEPPEAELVGHWPLIDHPRDVSLSKLETTANGLEFSTQEKSPGKNFGARFDGRKSFVEVADARKLQLGKQPFSISLWAEIDDDFGDPLGDLISCYDSKERRGFHLGIYSHGGVTNSQPNARQVHFGIDHAKRSKANSPTTVVSEMPFMYSPFACITDGCTLRHAMQVKIKPVGFFAGKVPTDGPIWGALIEPTRSRPWPCTTAACMPPHPNTDLPVRASQSPRTQPSLNPIDILQHE